MKQDEIENFFNMSFIDVIKILHLEKKVSINQLSKMTLISRDTFMRLCKKYNLNTLSHAEAIKLTPFNKGEKHWAFNKKRPDCSKRMKENNPSIKNSNLIKMAISKSEYLKLRPLPQEQIFLTFLEKHKIKYIFQYPINRYVIDFFIPENNICIEIESDDKWCKDKRNRSINKRLFLEKLGYKVLNLSRKKLNDTFIYDILKTNNVII